MTFAADGKILLLGAGYTLKRTANILGRERVILTATSEEKVASLRAEGFSAYQVRLEEPSTLEVVFNAERAIAQIVDSVPPLRIGPPDTGVAALLHFLAKATPTRVRRIMYLSTTGVYGTEDGGWVDESSATNPNNPRGTARVACEARYRTAAVPVTVLRLPAIYGPDRGIVQSLRCGKFPLVDGGGRWSNRIHVDDLAAIISRAIEVSELPAVLCVADDEPAMTREVVRFYCDRLGIKIPEEISLEEAKQRGLHTMTGNQRVSNALMKATLGIALRYPNYRSVVDQPSI